MSALLGLSLRHCGANRHQQPRVPTNEERLREYRKATQPVLGNGYPWPFRNTYEAEALADGPMPVIPYEAHRG